MGQTVIGAGTATETVVGLETNTETDISANRNEQIAALLAAITAGKRYTSRALATSTVVGSFMHLIMHQAKRAWVRSSPFGMAFAAMLPASVRMRQFV